MVVGLSHEDIVRRCRLSRREPLPVPKPVGALILNVPAQEL